MRRMLVIVLVLVLLAAACRGDDAGVTTDLPTLPATTTSTSSSTSTSTSTSTSAPAPAATTTTLPPLQGVALESVAEGLSGTVWAGVDPGTNDVIVVERRGRILGLDGGVRFDIDARVGPGSGERGLLGLAFHPDDPDRFFVNYTDNRGDTVVSEFQRVGGVMDASTERVVLEISQPASNHNGGNLAFGPDGMLYIGMGDGGAADDRFGNGQDPFTVLGAMLRLDPTPSGDAPYTIPDDNPFADGGGDPLVWATGLRNPWRYSFDADLLYVADVGQSDWEEVSVVAVDAARALNFGWPVLEGSHCFQTRDCDPTGLIQPVTEYSHADGFSITGGVVMHDPTIPELEGFYVYGDYGTGFVRGFFYESGAATRESALLTGVGNISSFGFDADGRVLVVTLDGEIFRIVPVR